jgi:hypothetical protein
MGPSRCRATQGGLPRSQPRANQKIGSCNSRAPESLDLDSGRVRRTSSTLPGHRQGRSVRDRTFYLRSRNPLLRTCRIPALYLRGCVVSPSDCPSIYSSPDTGPPSFRSDYPPCAHMHVGCTKLTFAGDPTPRSGHFARSMNRIRIGLRSRVNVKPVCSWRCCITSGSS